MRKFLSIILTTLLGMTCLSANAVKININVDNSSRVNIKVNYVLVENIAAGVNEFEVNEYSSVSIEAKEGAFITSVVRESTSTQEYVSNMSSCNLYINSGHEGETWTVTSANADELRDGRCRIYVDDPSKVAVQRSGSYTYVTLAEGWNDVKYATANELPLTIGPANYGTQLYQVKVNGEVAQPQGTAWRISPNTGDEIEIFANFPDIDCPVQFTYVSEEAKGAITSVTVDGVAVEDYNEEGFAVKAGKNMTLYFNTQDYNLKQLMVNNATISYVYGSYSFLVTDETTVYVDAEKYGTVNATIDIDQPENVIVYKGYYYNNDIITLLPGENPIELSQQNAQIQIKPESGCYITSLTDNNGTQYSADYSGYYTVTMTDGMVLTVKTGRIVRDKTAMIYIDDRAAATQYFGFTRQDRSGIDVATGYNALPFYDGDNPFNMSWYGAPYANIYKNGEVVEPMYANSTTYELRFEDNDVLKIFLASNPETYNVSVELGTTAIEAGNVTVKRDRVQTVENWTEGFTVLGETEVSITPAEGYEILVEADGNAVEPDENGTYTLTIKADTQLRITAPAHTIAATIEIDHPENAIVYTSEAGASNALTLQEGTNTLEVEEGARICIAPQEDRYIASVTDGAGTAYEADENGIYTVTLTEGMALTITTGVIERDLKALIYIDNINAATEDFSFARKGQKAVELASGYNTVEFYSGDNPFTIALNGSEYANIYRNDVAVEPADQETSTYRIELEQDDVVKIFMASNPATCNVTFEADSEIAENVSVVRDLILPVSNWEEGFATLPGTQVSLTISGSNTTIEVKANGTLLEADEEGTYTFSVSTDTKVSITDPTSVGISAAIAAQGGKADVYSLQGVRLIKQATATEIGNLPSGIYIIGGKKAVKR